MAYALQQLINGVTLGMIYGLIAVGYTMVYGIIGMINFAHGDVFMIGAFLSLIALTALSGLGLTSVPLALALTLVLAAGIAALYGWTVERLAYRPLRGSFRLAPLISAIGMSIVLQNYAQVSQGARVKPIAPLLPGGVELMNVDGFAVQLSWMQIAITVTTLVVLAAFTWLVSATSLGRSMRACEQDRKMAGLLGIDTDRTISLTFVLGAMLAAVAGLMFLLYYGVIDFFIGFVAGVKAFTAAVLGGYAASIWMLSWVVREIPVSVAYAIWSGLGTAGIAAVGFLLLGESMDLVKIAAIGMIVTGVLVLNLHGAH